MADVLHTALTAAWSRKRRLVGTALSVVLGVAFLLATLVLGTSARAGFEAAFSEANAGTDALVRVADPLTTEDGVSAAPFDATVVDEVAAVDGVDAVTPAIDGFAQILGADGEPLGGEGPPTVGAAWIEDPSLTGYDLAEGRAPSDPGEVVIDRESADTGELGIGDTTTVLTPAPVAVTVVGLATFGDQDSLSGVTLAAFSFDEAQRLFVGGADAVTGIVVSATAGIDQEELVDRLGPVLPDGLEAITGDDLTAEMEAQIEGDFLGFFVTALLAFAAIALLVSAFSIFNTFSILVAQRTRESALLRMLGASRAQVLVAGVAEAAVIGLVGSALGLGAGLLVASGLIALIDAAGFGLPIDGLQVDLSSVVTASLVGVLVTIVGGLVPAWRAARVAPIAALREVAVDTSDASRWRLVAGSGLGAAGVALVLSGTASGGSLPRAGLGAAVVLVAVILVGPVVARPVGNALGAPLRLRGIPGELARRNAVRNPRRTSATAAALLVGVGVVSLFTVFGASVSASIEDAVDRSFGGDLMVDAGGFSGVGLSPDLLGELRDLPEIDAAAGLGFGTVRIAGDEKGIGFSDTAALDEVADFEVVEGDMGAVGDGRLAVSTDSAATNGWTLGDRLAVQFPDGATEDLELVAIYDDRALGGNYLLPASAWAAHVAQPSYAVILMRAATGVDLEDARAAAEHVVAGHGSPEVRDRDQFVASEAAEVDTLLGVIYALLAVAILIALMGIANTLSLSMHERTRELGLLRAVGLSRPQLRAMVRWESVIVATFGTVGGIGMGVFLAWGLIRTLAAAEGLGTFSLPVGQLVVVVAVGAVAGVLAGLRPAWRAARLDVLAAVATD